MDEYTLHHQMKARAPPFFFFGRHHAIGRTYLPTLHRGDFDHILLDSIDKHDMSLLPLLAVDRMMMMMMIKVE